MADPANYDKRALQATTVRELAHFVSQEMRQFRALSGSLFEDAKVGGDLGGFVVGEAGGRHGGAWLQTGGIQDPGFQVVWAAVGDSAAGDAGATGHPLQAGADRAGGARDAGDDVAAGTRLRRQQLLTFGGRAAR